MNKAGMLKPALIGGMLLGMLSALPYFDCACCIWVIGGGLFAAYLYVKDSPIPVMLGRGVVLGLATGLIGSLVYILFKIPLYPMMKKDNAANMEHARQLLESWLPQLREYLQPEAMPSEIGVGALIFSFIFMLGIFCLFSMLGGAVGVALF
jgi:ABC-type spermidine/putrescine transport system permease subunit I